jgi:hypothetical protein
MVKHLQTRIRMYFSLRKFAIIVSTLVIVLMISSSVPANVIAYEAPPVQWQQFFNGSYGYSVLQTEDGGYVVTGTNASTTLLIGTDSFGNLSWVKEFQIGGSETALPYLVQTNDGGYALGGTWANRFILIKVDFEGNTQWNKIYEHDAPYNYLSSFIQTSDEGYALAGTFSPPQNISHSVGQIWFVKADASGNMQWNKTIVGPHGNFANSVLQTIDGGYVIICTNWVSDSLPSFFKIVKTDSDGNEQWNKTYGGAGEFSNSECYSGIITADGGYLLAGDTGYPGNAWLIKTDAQGNEMWNKTYGQTGSVIISVIQTQDGGYAFTGTGVSNWKDSWVIKTDAYGSIDWNLTIVGSSFVGKMIEDFGKPITQTDDGGYALTGTQDGALWLLKLAAPSPPSSITQSLLEIIAIAIVAVMIGITVLMFIFRKSIFKNR